MSEITVKALEWAKRSLNGICADNEFYWLHDMDGDGLRIRGSFGHERTYRWFKSQEEGKAVAQADYETRIKSALEIPTESSLLSLKRDMEAMAKALEEIEREASKATSSTHAIAVSACQRIRDIALVANRNREGNGNG